MDVQKSANTTFGLMVDGHPRTINFKSVKEAEAVAKVNGLPQDGHHVLIFDRATGETVKTLS